MYQNNSLILVAKTGSITKDEMKGIPEYAHIVANEDSP